MQNTQNTQNDENLQNTQNVQNILQKCLAGFQFGDELNHCLNVNHPFHFDNIMNRPKDNHGEFTIDAGEYHMKPMTYHVLHTGGFLRLCTKKGRIYWLNQNSHNHTSPDWKFHISCKFDQIPQTWNTLVALFIESRAEIGLKVLDPNESNEWPEFQYGREFTIYVYAHCKESETNFVKDEAFENPDFRLGEEIESFYNEVFWFSFLHLAEFLLIQMKVEKLSKCAKGDLELPNCKYFTLRNESFVKIDNNFVYPPNDCGFNASHQTIPHFLLKLLYFLMHCNK